jgi:hypothetical protein
MTTAVWTVAEIALESERDRDNPYLDIDVVAHFRGPGGRVIERPAFWDGDRSWRIRFAPTVAGDWTWRTSSSDKEDGGLHDLTGSVLAVMPAEDATATRRHGFLRPSNDATHLVHADGKPFFWLGDTHWRFAWEKWNEANKPGWASQFRGMVDRRVEQGFSVYQTNLMSFGRGWNTWPGWEEGEPYRRLVPEHFSRVIDRRMDYIADRGLVNALGIGWYAALDIDPLGMVRFARYLVARYGALPMVWTLGGEVAGYDADLRQMRIDGWRDVALAIREADAYRHPVTAHLTNERPIADHYQDEDWLSLTLNQLGHGDLDMSHRVYGEHLRAHGPRPLVEGESMYEGITTVEPLQRRTATDTMVRQIAYRAIQSGCCGYTYGAQGCWDNVWDEREEGTMWGRLPWFEGIDLPGGTQMGYLRRFYESLPWWTLRPDGTSFTTTDGENALFYPPAVSSDPDRCHIVVFFGETHRDGGVEHLTGLSHQRYRVRWFDPRCGAWVHEEESRVEEGRILLPAQPDPSLDWVLVASAL